MRRIAIPTLLVLTTLFFSCKKETTSLDSNAVLRVENNSAVLNERVEITNQPLLIGNSQINNVSTKGIQEVKASEAGCSSCTQTISSAQSGHLNINSGETLCITSTGSFSGGINLNGGNLSVCGIAQLSYLNINNGTVTVNDGAVFALGGALNINSGATFINYSSSGVNISGGLNNNAVFENYGTVNVSGHVNNNSNGQFTNACKMVIAGNFNQNAILVHSGFLNVNGSVTFNSAISNELVSGALIECQNLTINTGINGTGSNYSVLKVNQTTTINSNGNLSGLLDICDANGIETNNGTEDANVTYCEAYIPANGNCNPGFGEAPAEEPTWTLVANVTAPNAPSSSDKLSATCVQILGNYAYVSWHWNGEPNDYAGLLEVYDVSNPSNPVVISSLSTNQIDFNHLFVDPSEYSPTNRKMWVVGSRKIEGSNLASPAWLGEFSLSNETFPNTSYVETDIPSFSGNTVTKLNGFLLVTSAKTGGALTAINLNNNSSYPLIQNEQMRHLTSNENWLVALQQGSANSAIHYAPIDGGLDNFEKLNIAGITPDDGKNVAHLDGDVVYVAMGNNGLNAYQLSPASNTPIHSFDPNQGLSNGVSTDDNHVYLANGQGGLYILKKDDLSEVGKYNYNGSANYVASSNNIIFVANGTGGLKIIKKN